MKYAARCAALLLWFVAGVAHAQGEAPRFTVERYAVEGAKLLPDETVRRVVAPYTGPQRALADVQAAAAALQQAYREAGHGTVQVIVPQQRLTGGVVTLQVIDQPRIASIKITGNRQFDEANIRAALPALREGSSPDAAAVSRNAQLANESPARQLNVVMRPGAKPDEVTAEVEVTDEKPWRLFTTLDNTGTSQTGKHRLGLGAQHANLFNRDHVGSVQYQTSVEKPGQVHVWSFGYHVPLYALGDSLDFTASYSDTDSGTSQTAAGPLTITGKGRTFGTRYNQRLRRLGDYDQRLTWGFDWKVFDNSCTLGAFGAAGCGPNGADVTVHPVSLTYSGQWSWPSAQAGFYLGALQNIPGGNHGRDADFAAARPTAKADYNLLRFGVNAATDLGGWQASVNVNAQHTDHALISGEQFGLGGATVGRGFAEREITGDYGYAGSLELYTPDVGQRLQWPATVRFLAFYDFGHTVRNNPQPGDVVRQTVSSAGGGVRIAIGKNVSLKVDVGRVLQPGGAQARGDTRGHFAAVISY